MWKKRVPLWRVGGGGRGNKLPSEPEVFPKTVRNHLKLIFPHKNKVHPLEEPSYRTAERFTRDHKNTSGSRFRPESILPSGLVADRGDPIKRSWITLVLKYDWISRAIRAGGEKPRFRIHAQSRGDYRYQCATSTR